MAGTNTQYTLQVAGKSDVLLCFSHAATEAWANGNIISAPATVVPKIVTSLTTKVICNRCAVATPKKKK